MGNQHFDLRLQSDQHTCVFHSAENIEVDLHEILPFGGKLWQCVGAISNTGESFFKVKSKWIMIKDGKELTTIREKTQKRKKYQKEYRQENLDEYKDYQKGYQKEYRQEKPDRQKEY